LLLGYLAGADVYSRDRLLRLLAWFESIPLHGGEILISNQQIKKMRSVLEDESDVTRIGISQERLKQVLQELRRTPLKERMIKSINENRERFGLGRVPKEIEADCHAAVGYRNKAAHGSMQLEKSNLDDFARAIHAVELICTMSMVRELEVNADKLVPIFQHPLLSYWAEISAKSRK
jgi:hypothetical protein